MNEKIVENSTLLSKAKRILEGISEFSPEEIDEAKLSQEEILCYMNLCEDIKCEIKRILTVNMN